MDSKGKILVVDDNDANRLFAQTALEDEGYEVVLAANGAEAVEAFRAHRPDCVLLDVRMPDEDGFSVCAKMRTLQEGAATPILFLTALRDVETFDRAQLAGADDFLTKPVRPSELITRVHTALRFRQLGAERHELAELVKQQRDELYRLSLQKEMLSSFVVHDLKNPVNAIDLHAQLLLHDRSATATVKEAASEIRSATRQLTRLIMNLLDVAKSAEGRLAPSRAPCNVTALVEAIVRDSEVEAKARDVTLTTRLAPVTAAVDADLLQRTVANLLENAIRHSPPHGEVSVGLESAEEGARTLKLRVADRGAGVPVSMRERIFDRFVQVDEAPVSSTRQGRGLGLTFCKLAVEAHDGQIWVEDGAPGAVFVARIPYGA